MKGQMQSHPLLISSLLTHAEQYHGDREIISLDREGQISRTCWGDIGLRARELADTLRKMGAKEGSIIGTLAWNTHRHLELYFAVSGIGAVLHTINPRMFDEQIEYVINHAADEILFLDSDFLDRIESLSPRLQSVRHYILLDDPDKQPKGTLAYRGYEDLLTDGDGALVWPSFDENTAATLCYTTGTTGHPKGVLYSHRSTLLHTWTICAPDAYGISAKTAFLLLVPLFHANAWGLPYAAAMTGAKLVLPRQHTDAPTLYRLLRDEHVTHTAGVPTILQTLFEHIQKEQLPAKKELTLERVMCGGSAVPQSLFEMYEDGLGVPLQQGWGMTELNPCGVFGVLLPKHLTQPEDTRRKIKMRQGRPPFGVELKITSENNGDLPHDDHASGSLKVRGHWVVESYYKRSDPPLLDQDGFFDTGDIAKIDPDGYVRIVDRAKDIIKSGGEWISSIDLENAARLHPEIRDAAVIGVPHPKWQERPVMICTRTNEARVDASTLMEFLQSHVARWWLPDKIEFADELPLNANGKVNKAQLHKTYGGLSLR